MYIGTKNGDTRLGPFPNRARAFSSKVWSPPVPVPTMAPTRLRSTLPQLLASGADGYMPSLPRPRRPVLQRPSHRPQLLGFLVRDVDVEFLLEGHYQRHRVEAVRAQVLHEARIGRELVALDAQLLGDDVLDL